MSYSSRRLRLEERNVIRKLIGTLFLMVCAGLFLFFIGIPLLAKTILFFSSLNPNAELPKETSTSVLILPPVLDPIPPATNSSPIRLSGSGEPDTQARIYVNGIETKSVDTKTDGSFSYDRLALSEGVNSIFVTSVKENLESSRSAVYDILYKKSGPKLEIDNPKDGENFSSDQKTITVEGSTESDCRIQINGRLAIVDTQGKFRYSLSLSDGPNPIRITSIDSAGNQEEKTLTVHYYP